MSQKVNWKKFVNNPRLWLWLMWAVWVLVICGVQFYRLQAQVYTGFDLAIFSQSLWNATHGQGFWSSIQGHSYWSDHLEPILWVFWPLMRWKFSPLWLLWTQTIVLASSIFPLYHIARRFFSPSIALVFPALFLIHVSTWNAATMEFHVLTLATPIVLGACAVLLHPQAKWWSWMTLLLALCILREELGLVVVGFGVLAFIRKKSWKWWLPAVVLGLTSVIVFRLIQAEFVEGYRYTYYFPWIQLLAQGDFRAGVTLIGQLIFRLEVVRMLLEAILAVGAVWILAPSWMIPGLPVLVSFILLDANISHALIESYHATIPLSFMWAALPVGVQKFKHFLDTSPKFQKILPISPHHTLMTVLIVVTAMQLTTWFFLWRAYPANTQPYSQIDITRLLERIPSEAGVASSAAFMTTLSGRQQLQATWYIFRGQDEFEQADYTPDPELEWILFDTNEFLDLRTQRDEFFSEHQRFMELLNTQFSVADHVGSVILFQRTDRPRQIDFQLQAVQMYVSGTPESIPVEFVQTGEEVVVANPNVQLIGQHLFVELYVQDLSRWKALEKQFITPVIQISSGDQVITLPFGYGLVTPETAQSGDKVTMDIVLPVDLLIHSKSISIQGQLRELKGMTYGRHQTLVQRTSWVETFLDKTIPIQ